MDNADELADQREFEAAEAVDQSDKNIKALELGLGSIPTGLAAFRLVQATRGYPHKPGPPPTTYPPGPNVIGITIDQVKAIIDQEIGQLKADIVSAEQIAAAIAKGVTDAVNKGVGSDINAIKGAINSILSTLHLPGLGGGSATVSPGQIGVANPGNYTYSYRDNTGTQQSITLPGILSSKDQFDALLGRVAPNSPITVLSAIASFYSGPDSNGVWVLVPSRFGQ